MTYSVKDICQRFGVTETTVRTWIHSGELRALNCGRSLAKRKPRWRVTQEALDKFERLRSTMPQQPPAPRPRQQSAAASGIIQFYSDK